MPCWLQIAQGLLTPLIAVITTFIAWQQWKSSKLKLKMDIYERRLKIYQETQKFIAEVNQEFKPGLPELYAFYGATSEADFLFPSEIRNYLSDIFSRANKLRSARGQYCDYTKTPPPGYDHQKICDTLEEQEGWFIDQHPKAIEKFKPFLDLTK